MLVLTRKVGESIESSGPCKIMIVATEAGKVRIGLVGPQDTEFVRSELLEHGGKDHDDKRTA
jgi:carbon storage regulator CsrA